MSETDPIGIPPAPPNEAAIGRPEDTIIDPAALLEVILTWSRKDAAEEAARRSAAMTSPGMRRISPYFIYPRL